MQRWRAAPSSHGSSCPVLVAARGAIAVLLRARQVCAREQAPVVRCRARASPKDIQLRCASARVGLSILRERKCARSRPFLAQRVGASERTCALRLEQLLLCMCFVVVSRAMHHACLVCAARLAFFWKLRPFLRGDRGHASV
eukprot:Amastigsp_a3081_7.p2 type:complete len:142 gc:universal Amastigsp_a3081_7:531-106(-)